MHEEFLCHVTAYGVSGGTRVGVPLGVYRAPSLPLAVAWLRERADWLARLLDPEPEAPWLPAGCLVEAAERAWAVPDALRAWSTDIDGHLRLAEDLLAGELVEVRWHDESVEYELLAESVDAARMRRVSPPPTSAGAGAGEVPGEDTRRRAAAAVEESATLKFAAVRLEARSRGPNSYFGLRVPAPAHTPDPQRGGRPGRSGGLRLRERLSRRRS
ncbi:hypothetical protein [Streptomyces sp. NPDC007088]|uniref:hypothetical protein n=1 Tax=Streptomyces sp. NPDC007088 TaxID=3364773 RepID=UPI0036BCD430